jgi:hypothetical protein
MTIAVENVLTGQGNNGANSSWTLSPYSNSGTNRVIVMQICMAVAGATPPTVSSITGGGLTWNKRKAFTLVEASDSDALEVWWAFAASQITAQQFTVNFTGTPRTQSMQVFSVSGAFDPTNPWDPDASLPSTASQSRTEQWRRPRLFGWRL